MLFTMHNHNPLSLKKHNFKKYKFSKVQKNKRRYKRYNAGREVDTLQGRRWIHCREGVHPLPFDRTSLIDN